MIVSVLFFNKLCFTAPCGPLPVDNQTAFASTVTYTPTSTSGLYTSNTVAAITCNTNYVKNGTIPPKCVNGSWDQPAAMCLGTFI